MGTLLLLGIGTGELIVMLVIIGTFFLIYKAIVYAIKKLK